MKYDQMNESVFLRVLFNQSHYFVAIYYNDDLTIRLSVVERKYKMPGWTQESKR